MSQIKPLSTKSKFSQSIDINQISPDLRSEYGKIMYDIQHQLFFDPNLNHQQRMFVLHQRGAIENEFLLYLRDCIYTLSIPEDIRVSLFQNLNRLSANLIPIDTYSSTNQYYLVTDDSDEDIYIDSLSDSDPNDNDTYHDLENNRLDDLAMEYDIAASHATEEHEEEQPYDNNQQDNLPN